CIDRAWGGGHTCGKCTQNIQTSWYIIHDAFRALYVRRSILKSILLLKGSQCREASTGEICSSFLLTGLPACVVKPLQMIQNTAAHLVFNQPKRAHVTPLLIDLPLLPVPARLKFNV